MNFLKVLAVITIITSLTSCYNYLEDLGTPPPEFLITSHAEVMSTYKTKSDVLMEFGSPDERWTVDSIESINYDYGQIEEGTGTSTSIGHGSSQGTSSAASYMLFAGVAMSALNPLYTRTNYATNFNNFQVTTSRSKSETFKKYVKFWFIGDNVIKWETFGVDQTIYDPNPEYEDYMYRVNRINNKRQENMRSINPF